MADRQLELWINERWYEALEKHFEWFRVFAFGLQGYGS